MRQESKARHHELGSRAELRTSSLLGNLTIRNAHSTCGNAYSALGNASSKPLPAALSATFCSVGDHPSRDRRSTRCRSAFAATFPANTHSILSIRLDLLGAGYTKHGLAHSAMASPGLARGELRPATEHQQANHSVMDTPLYMGPPLPDYRSVFGKGLAHAVKVFFDPGLREAHCGKLVIFLLAGKIHAQAAYPRLRRKGIYFDINCERNTNNTQIIYTLGELFRSNELNNYRGTS